MLLLSAKKTMTSLKQKKHEQLGRIVFNSCQQDHHMIRESCGLSQGLPLFIPPYTNQTPWIYEVRWERIGTNPPHRIRILTKMDGNKWTICTICIYVLHGTGWVWVLNSPLLFGHYHPILRAKKEKPAINEQEKKSFATLECRKMPGFR